MIIRMVSIHRSKMEQYWHRPEAQQIKLCRFVFAEVVRETKERK